MAKKNSNNEALQALVDQGAEALAQQVLDLQEQLTETTEKLRATEATKGNPFPVVKLKSGIKQVNGGIRHNGEILSPAQLAENVQLCEELHASGSGLISDIA